MAHTWSASGASAHASSERRMAKEPRPWSPAAPRVLQRTDQTFLLRNGPRGLAAVDRKLHCFPPDLQVALGLDIAAGQSSVPFSTRYSYSPSAADPNAHRLLSPFHPRAMAALPRDSGS